MCQPKERYKELLLIKKSFLKVKIEDALRKLCGSWFHSFGAHTTKDLSPQVLLFEEGTSKSSFVTERCCKQLVKYGGQAPFIDL